jgi:hypothetical protein
MVFMHAYPDLSGQSGVDQINCPMQTVIRGQSGESFLQGKRDVSFSMSIQLSQQACWD